MTFSNKKVGFCVGFITVLVFVGATFWVSWQYTRPGALTHEAIVMIERGDSVNKIASKLSNSGVIENSYTFKLGLKFFSPAIQLKAGEYLFTSKISQKSVVDLLQSGKTVMRMITIPEGLTSFQVVDLIKQTEGLVGEIEKIPKEGSLLPETYYFAYGDSRQSLMKRMRKSLKEFVKKLWARRPKDFPIQTMEEVLILASIVEKETGKDGERPHVAAVFLNRLQKGMRLQSDPTVIYGITFGKQKFKRRLTRKDLKKSTPFNTYVIQSLPPTPIASAGKKAIRAVFFPKKSDDLFFVADGLGGHVFARTLLEHNRNVSAWRKKMNKK